MGSKARPVSEQISAIVRRIRGAKGEDSVSMKEIRDQCNQAGFTNEQIDHCMEQYENVNVWHINQNRTKVTFV